MENKVFDVYHREPLLTTMGIDSSVTPDLVGWPDSYELVASVECRNKERVYQLTQHIESSWLENAGVRALTEQARSTSVGDIIVNIDDCVPWIVAGTGFQLVLDVRGRLYSYGIHDFDEVLFTATWEDVICAIEDEIESLDAEDKRYIDWWPLIIAAKQGVGYVDVFEQVQLVIRPLVFRAVEEACTIRAVFGESHEDAQRKRQANRVQEVVYDA